MQRFNIDSCAMLVEFNASAWTARKLDRKTSDEVVATKGAGSKDAARVNKHLLAGRSELEVIQQHIGKVRGWVDDHTMPWSNNGLKLLPTVNFVKFDAKIREEEATYWTLVDNFIDIYPTLITAQAMALGDMFKRDDFPTPESMKDKFGFNVNYMPVPTAGDFRIDVGDEAQKALKEQLAKLADERVEKALASVRERMLEYLKRASDRLTVDVADGEEVPRKFHDSLVEGGFELCDLVKGLNVVNDRGLEEARAKLELALCSITPVSVKARQGTRELSIADTLREDLEKRAGVKQEVDSILEAFKW